MATIDGVRQLVGKIAAIAELSDIDDLADDERDQLRDALEKVWRAHAVYLAPFYGAVANEPGYIARDAVLVPVHLAEDLPGPGALAELVEIGLTVRIAADSTMCLSGSAALLNALEHVGDLDFCEYAELLDSRRAVEVATAVDVHASRLETPICQRAQLAGTPPLDVSCHDGWNAAARLAIEHGVKSGVRYVKLDFVARSAVVGVVEATNVVLLLDAGRTATLARSFAGQEVPVGTAHAILPRPLCDPMSIGNYINFLRDQIGTYATKQPVKALKRGLSLARMMFLDTSGEAILDLLRDPQGALQAAIDARHALVVKLERAHCPSHTRRAVLEELRSELEPWIADLRIAALAKPRRPDWASEAQNSLKSLMSEVHNVIASA